MLDVQLEPCRTLLAKGVRAFTTKRTTASYRVGMHVLDEFIVGPQI